MGLLLWAWPTQSVPHTKVINPHQKRAAPDCVLVYRSEFEGQQDTDSCPEGRLACSFRREYATCDATRGLLAGGRTATTAGGGREDELLICSQRSASVRVLRRLRARIDDWQDRDLIWSARLQLQAKQLANLPITSADHRL